MNQLIEETGIVNPDRLDYAILNKTDSNQNDLEEARKYIVEEGALKVLNSNLRERKAFSNGAAEGLAVTEMKRKDYKAVAELKALFDEILALQGQIQEVA